MTENRERQCQNFQDSSSCTGRNCSNGDLLPAAFDILDERAQNTMDRLTVRGVAGNITRPARAWRESQELSSNLPLGPARRARS